MTRPVTTVYSAADAPREYASISPFRNDDRCEDFQVVIGSDRNEVTRKTRLLHAENIAEGSEFGERFVFDWDHVYDTVNDVWVGFTCKDKEPFDVEA